MILPSIPIAIILSLLIINSHQTMLISSPAINPFDESKIPYSYANVGTIPYGKTLSFDLIQKADIDYCKAPENVTHLKTPTYLLIDGEEKGCSFVTKAINAQTLGAQGVIFVSDLVHYYGKNVLINDGNGQKVHISVLLISSKTYQQLKTIKNVSIKVQYEVYKSPKVNITYFLSASGRQNYIFLRQFQPYHQQIAQYINFNPLYLTIPCLGCPQKDCLVSRLYCMFEMDTYLENVGQEILKEQLKQWNIWKKYGTSTYLKYMNQFDKYCTPNWYGSEVCGNGILNDLQISNPTLEQGPTEIMHDWRKKQITSGFLSTPELTINDQPYAGTYNATQVFYAICQNLEKPPSSCPGQSSSDTKSSKMGWIIASIIIACIISIVIGFVLYRKCVKKQLTKDMFSKVNELVAKYATKVSEHNKKRKEKLKMRLTEEL